jgi:sialate O-acetylesterase
MKLSPWKSILWKSLLAVIATGAGTLRAEVTLGSPFTDHMVLQRDMKVPVWGTADAGENVTVGFAGQTKTAMAGADGKWRVDLDAMGASAEGREFTVSGTKTAQPVKLEDVLVGEVWLASGQSNMVFPVEASGPFLGMINYEGEMAAATYPEIRMFTAQDTKAYAPAASVSGTWEVCSPDTVGDFSAVGYVFARDLYQQLKVPVGIVTAASGASCAEAWISREAMTADASIKPYLDALDAAVKYYRATPQGPMADAPVRPTPINKPRTPVRRLTDPVQDQHMPTVLFNGMIAPLMPYAMRGVIWYQGESIVGGTAGLNLYGHMVKTLIADWRGRWGEGDFPFIIVQLPGQKNISNNPRIREEQQTVLDLPNTGMAVTIDTGETNNVHPRNKAPTGYRLMLIALAKAYGQNIEYSGPMYAGMKVEGNAVRISFTHTGGGLVAKAPAQEDIQVFAAATLLPSVAAKGGAQEMVPMPDAYRSAGIPVTKGGDLKGFQIAGADGKFVDADAKIDGDTVVVSSAAVAAPAAVRYAWDDYPEGMGCNLYNSYDLPAAPFRTDKWDYPIAGIVEN